MKYLSQSLMEGTNQQNDTSEQPEVIGSLDETELQELLEKCNFQPEQNIFCQTIDKLNIENIKFQEGIASLKSLLESAPNFVIPVEQFEKYCEIAEATAPMEASERFEVKYQQKEIFETYQQLQNNVVLG